MTAKQEAILCKFDGNVFFFLDNNKAGREGTDDAGPRLKRRGQKFWVCSYPDSVEEGAQPDNLNQEEIQNSLDTAKTLSEWRNENGILPKPQNFNRTKYPRIHGSA